MTVKTPAEMKPEEDFVGKYTSTNGIHRRLIDGYFQSVRKLIAVIPTNELRTALEVGCGAGFSTTRLRHDVPAQVKLEASEFLDWQVVLAQERLPTVRVVQEDIYRLARPDASLDLIFCLEVLEHLERVPEALAEIHRTSEYAIIGVPHEPWWRVLNMVRGKYWREFGNTPGHIQHWSKRKFLRLLEQSGFEVVATESPLPWTLVLVRRRQFSSSPTRLLYAATYYVSEYVRQAVILRHLRALPNTRVDVVVVNRHSWTRYFEFLWKFIWLDKSQYHFIYLGWRTIEIAPFLRWLTRTPLILDAFVPIFETLCYERKIVDPHRLVGRLAYWWERLALRSVSRIITDTKANADYFSKEYQLDRSRFIDVPVGVDRSIYFIPPNMTPHQGVRVFFYGTFLPLHGVTVIIEAANLLRQRTDIHWLFIGDGPERQRAEDLAKNYALTNVDFLPRVPQTILAQKIAEADICLGGPFSDVAKAQRVITGKTYQFLAMGKPVIVSDTPGNRELLTHEKDCYMVRPGSAASLASAVRRLADEKPLRDCLIASVHDTVDNAERKISTQLQSLLFSLTT